MWEWRLERASELHEDNIASQMTAMMAHSTMWALTRAFSARAGPPAGARRLHNAAHPASIGFAFDIDGVLLKGKSVLPAAQRALAKLRARRVPFILLTNGGGVTEAEKAAELSGALGTAVEEWQVVLAHTPMRTLAERHGRSPVLVVGRDSCRRVAHSYGFERPVLADEILAWRPPVWPFRDVRAAAVSGFVADKRDADRESGRDSNRDSRVETMRESKGVDFATEPFAAILVLHDSRDWGRDCQLIIDLLRSRGGLIGTESPASAPQSIPIYFSNSDFVWSNEFPVNRFAQGAFRLAVETLYTELTGGQRMVYTKFGKPERPTYEYATLALQDTARRLWPKEASPCRTVYAIGDNPASDIRGANQNGWKSILVRTGVWRQDVHGDGHGANHVVRDVEEAVNLVLDLEGINTREHSS